ncbi:uncharacterized protein LOC100822669 [Brachypodium distachyon]|uniref:uncharacterized protein LOC100822669 n=1 Tax=Brachypodium distachyon TaxID=15368 RepID=UPI000D0C99DE|nr:uncharacterized protein LOC100822669 [Brachypodium distachyon]|eukprot:XP_024310871.1 uncharacterized protein LOC100822669 [Brachypodium distachyon]
MDLPRGMLEVCSKLSNYMMYLLVTHPSMLPLAACAVATLENHHLPESQENEYSDMTREELLVKYSLHPSKETLKEMVSMWARLLIYSAGRSRAEMHASQLSSGGELITFVWLLMAHHGLGDSLGKRIEITNQETIKGWNVYQRYAFYYPEPTPCRVDEITG